MKQPWQDLSSKTIYENPWIKVSEHQVLNPNGSAGIYGKVHYKKITVAAIPFSDQNETILVGQYRFPTNSYSWEIPMGGAEYGEDALEAAKRELREETGVTANEWRELMRLHTSNSVTDETAIIYCCKDLQMQTASPDEDELLSIKKVDFQQAFEMAMNGEIEDAISIAAIFKLKAWIDKKLF